MSRSSARIRNGGAISGEEDGNPVITETTDGTGNPLSNPPPAEETTGEVNYTVPEDWETTVGSGPAVVTQLCMALRGLPMLVMLQKGNANHIKPIIHLVEIFWEIRKETMDEIEVAIYGPQVQEATASATEKHAQLEASTSTQLAGFTPSDSLRAALMFLYGLGVPRNVLGIEVSPGAFGSGLAAVAGVLPRGTPATIPSAGDAVLPEATRARDLREQQRAVVIPKKTAPSQYIQNVKQVSMFTENVPNQVDQLERDLASQKAGGIDVDYKRMFSPKMQTYMAMSVKPPEGASLDWQEWDHATLVRVLRKAGDAHTSTTDGSTSSVSELMLSAVNSMQTPYLKDHDSSYNQRFLADVPNLFTVNLGEDSIKRGVEQEPQLMLTLLKALEAGLTKDAGVIGRSVADQLKTVQAHKLRSFQSWWSTFMEAYFRDKGVMEAHAKLTTKYGKGKQGGERMEPLPKRTRQEGQQPTKPKPQGGHGDKTKPSGNSSGRVPTGECCYCGRQNHTKEKCTLAQPQGPEVTREQKQKWWHPNANWTPTRRWVESPFGQRWSKMDPPQTVCPMNKVLDKENAQGWISYTFKPYPASGEDSVQCHSMRDTTQQKLHGTPVVWLDILPNSDTTTPLRLEALLDTGSLATDKWGNLSGCDNYVREAQVERLVAMGYQVKEDGKRVQAYDGTQTRSLGSLQLRCRVASDMHVLNNTKSLETLCITVNIMPALSHEMIVGFNTIKNTHKLLGALAQRLGINHWDGSGQATEDTVGVMGATMSKVAPGGSRDPIVCATHTESEGQTGLLCRATMHPRKPRTGVTRGALFRARNKSNRAVSRRNALLSVNRLGVESTQGNTLDGLPAKINGSEKGKVNLVKLLAKYRQVFRRELGVNPARINPMEIVLRGDTIWGCSATQAPARLQSRDKAAEIVVQVTAMLEAGVIRLSRANAHSQVMLTPKKDNKWRFCIDYRRLNAATRPEGWPLPRIKDMIQRLGAKKCHWYGTLDLTKGYYQAPLAEESKHLTAFITPNGLYEWNRVAMGLRGAPSYFQKAMCTEVLNGLLYNICEIYLDDIIIFGKTEEEFQANLGTVLARLASKNIFINPDKCELGVNEIEYVGHTINGAGMKFSRERLHKVVEIEKPRRAKELKSFLGLANYFREHVKNHSILAQPLNEMLKHYNPKKVLVWTQATEAAFEALKEAVNAAPELFFIDYDLPIHLYTDASLIGIGAYLCQKRPDGTEIPIAFYSRSLREEERRWGIPCLEAYAIWQAFRNMDYLLRDAKTLVHTDHKNLVYIKENGSDKIIRWKLDLMEYDFELDAIAGADNPIADYMSRNEAAAEHDYVIDDARKATHCLASMQSLTPTELEEDIKFRSLNALESRMAIPQEAYDKILAVHNDVAGHHGVEATLQKLAVAGEQWPYMREHVKRFNQECDSCQKRSYEQYDVRAPHYNIGTDRPMESLSVDLIGPLKDSINGNRYILVCIDSFTRFMWCKAIPDTRAETVADAYLDHLGLFGAPYEFKSDGGKEFANGLMKELVGLVGSNKITTFAYSHQSNGIVERSNKELCRWMEHMLHNGRQPFENWEKALPFAVRIHNSSPIATIRYSPAELLYGDSIVLDKNILLPRANRPADETLSNWSKDRRALQDAMIAQAVKVQRAAQEKRASSPDKQFTAFRNGEHVLIAYPDSAVWKRRQPHKLAMAFKGPYKVLSHEGMVYTLQNLVTNQRVKKLVFHLRPYKYDATRVDPKDMALKDHVGEYYVEQIVSHTGSWKRPTGLRFVVKWVGYPIPEGDQLWKDLRNVKQMHDYMRRIGQGAYIPEMEESDLESDDDSVDNTEHQEEDCTGPRRRGQKRLRR
jgi:hypothetical protein